MFNIHLEDIMRFHAFTMRKDVCVCVLCALSGNLWPESGWLGSVSGQITTTLVHKNTHF